MPEAVSGRRLGELLSQLCAALGKPYGTKGEKMLPGYLRGLEDWPEAAIEWAVWRACKTWTAKSFPKPAELAALCAQSPHKKLAPDGPAAPIISEVERCRECGEWWGWHRVASLFAGPAHLVYLNTIRHRLDCPRQHGQEHELRTYQRSWIDGLPPVGSLEAGGEAWKAVGVLQLIYPVPPLPPEPTRRRPRARRTTTPVPVGEVTPTGLEDLVPIPPDAGDSWEPPGQRSTTPSAGATT